MKTYDFDADKKWGLLIKKKGRKRGWGIWQEEIRVFMIMTINLIAETIEVLTRSQKQASMST